MYGVNIKAVGAGSAGVRITSATTGGEIHGVSRLSVEIAPDIVTVAQIEVCAAMVDMEDIPARFLLVDPTTGDLKQVTHVEFSDGTSWSSGVEPLQPKYEMVEIKAIGAATKKVRGNSVAQGPADGHR